jgi:hypothetical protein
MGTLKSQAGVTRSSPTSAWSWIGILSAIGAGALAMGTSLVLHGRLNDRLLNPLLIGAACMGGFAVLAGVVAVRRLLREGVAAVALCAAVVSLLGGGGVLGWVWTSLSRDGGGSTAPLKVALAATAAATEPSDVVQQARPNPLHLRQGQRFPLAEMIPQPTASYTPQQVTQMWPAFQHGPFEKAGFNATSLPFRYSDPEGLGSDNEANAFAFLLSNALDWAPGCYCTRHAYFSFKRSRDVLEPMRREYDRRAIAPHIANWNATHAIGGSLTRTKAGYTGTLEIFNSHGGTVLDKNYAEPRPYFDLLGEMAADAMRLFGDEPSPALVAHLKKPRCHQMESISLLGSAAFMEEKSDEEFGVYQKIVEQDPDFAEVRHWWANQRYWRDRDAQNFEIQKALSIQSYLSEAPLSDFEPAKCADAALVAKYPEWLREAEQLVGPDHPTLLKLQLASHRSAQPFDVQLVDRAIRVGGKNPNNLYLLRAIGDAYNGSVESPGDADWAASIYYAGRQDLYVPGVGGKEYELTAFATQMSWLGRSDICAQAMTEAENEYQLIRLIPALFSMARFNEVLSVYDANQTKFHNISAIAAIYAGVAAAMTGNLDALEGVLKEHGDELAPMGLDKLLECYAAALRGETTDVSTLLPARSNQTEYGLWQWALLLAQADVLNGKTLFRSQFANYGECCPHDRLGWYLLDRYERMQPSPDGAAFYETLDWLFGSDPWVIQAVRDARARNVSVPAGDAEKVVAELKGFPAVRWPTRGPPPPNARSLPSCWRVAAAVHRLLPQEPEKARTIAYQNYGIIDNTGAAGPRFFANHLIHLIDQAHH